MEKIKSFKENKIARGLAILSLGIMATVGCSKEVEEPQTDISSTEIRAIEQTTRIRPGEVKFIESIEPDSQLAIRLKEELQLVDFMYPVGPKDDTAPKIDDTPQRLKAQIMLHGKSPEISQDAACDTIGIVDFKKVKHIGAVSLGGEKSEVLISWPLAEDGEPSEYMYMCSFESMEPKDDGVVIYAGYDLT
jgi:hypothetical protein